MPRLAPLHPAVLLALLAQVSLACAEPAPEPTARLASGAQQTLAQVASRPVSLDAFLDAADAFLGAHVTARGTVRYSRVDTDALAGLVAQIGAMDASALSAAERKAFLVNAYNVLVIRAVLDAGTPASPLDDAQFFDRAAYTVAGETLSLDGLEKQRLYRDFPDARLHFALVCAAQGCPPLRREAYRPGKLGEQLRAQTERALGLPHLVRVEGGTLKLSELFEWYRADFERDADGGTLASFVGAYRDDVPEGATVEFMPYDWTTNAAK